MSEFANFWGRRLVSYNKRTDARTVASDACATKALHTHQFKTLKSEDRLIYHVILVLCSCIWALFLALFLRLHVSVRNTRIVRITS